MTEEKMIQQLASLSEDRREILILYADGKSYQEIADLLNFSKDNVKYHMSHIYAALGIDAGDRPYLNRNILTSYKNLLVAGRVPTAPKQTKARSETRDTASTEADKNSETDNPFSDDTSTDETPDAEELHDSKPKPDAVWKHFLRLFLIVMLLLGILAITVLIFKVPDNEDLVRVPDVVTIGCDPEGLDTCRSEIEHVPQQESYVVDFAPLVEGLHQVGVRVDSERTTSLTICYKVSRDEGYACWVEDLTVFPAEGWKEFPLCTGHTDVTYRIIFNSNPEAVGDIMYRFDVQGNVTDHKC